MESLKILVVDDSATARHYFTGLVEELGHHAVTVATAGEAQARLGREPFDLVLCDLVMPDMDGLDLLQSLRQQGQDLPFLLVTSYGSLASAVQAVRLGADDYILRPIDPGLLAHRIQTVHERHQASLEKRLRQDLEAALATAGAVAHELNQPLMAIMASAELIDLTEEPARVRELANTIVQQAQRLGEVTNRLVSLVRYQAKPYVGDSVILDLQASSHGPKRTS